MTDTDVARDEMSTLFLDAWKLNTPPIWGSVPEVRWDGQEQAEQPAPDVAWARVAVRHSPTGPTQTTFGDQRRYERTGFVFVQVFAPNAQNQGLTTAEKLAIVVRDSLEGAKTPSGVWLRNASLAEVGPDGAWYQFNVTAEFMYEELK